MHMKKTAMRFTALSLAAVMLLLTSCSGDGKTEQQRFDEYLGSLPKEMVSSDDLNLNYLFIDPVAFGIEKELLKLPFTTKEENDQSYSEIEVMKNKLNSFNSGALDERSRLSKDVLVDWCERKLTLKNDYLLDNSYLGSYIGFQAQLPLLLMEFTFSEQSDVDSYFNILETSGDTFKEYAGMEKLRQESGVGMSQKILDKVIDQCGTFSATGADSIISAIDEKLDACEFLSAEEKTAAKAKNADLVKTKLTAAYADLGAELSTINGGEEVGLAEVPGGKEYYAHLIRAVVGVDMTPEEAKTYLEGKLNTVLAQYISLLRKHPEFETKSPSFTSLTSASAVLDFLGKEILADYPEVPGLSYNIKKVPASMADFFSPAAYLTRKVDQPDSWPGSIYINGDFKPDLFTTLGHEGYPGHMYQDAYYHKLDLPAVMYMIDVNGGSEGWATYIEWNMYEYAEDRDLAQLNSLNSQLAACVLSLADIGIHYEGWNFDKFYQFLTQYFGLDKETAEGQYDLNVETPANYLSYYLYGFKLMDLRASAEKKLGTAFDPVAFHEVILNTGPVGFSVVEKQVEAYLATKTEDLKKAS